MKFKLVLLNELICIVGNIQSFFESENVSIDFFDHFQCRPKIRPSFVEYLNSIGASNYADVNVDTDGDTVEDTIAQSGVPKLSNSNCKICAITHAIST